MSRPKPAISRWRRAWSDFRGKREPHGIVLLYHRVADEPFDPQLLCVSPENFRSHLAALRERFQLMHVEEMAERLGRGEKLGRTAAVTFDDGYVDNLKAAKPLLQAQRVPATVFVATGFVGTQRNFYWDELAALLLRSPSLPRSLHVMIRGRNETWDLGEETELSAEQLAEAIRWHVELPGNCTRRQKLYQTLCEVLKTLGNGDRERLMAGLRAQGGNAAAQYRGPGVMSAEDLKTLTQDGGVRVGAHTVNHVALSGMERAEQAAEIGGSKNMLEEILGASVTSLAYPYGGPCDYDAQSAGLAEACGFRSAWANFSGVVWRGADSFHLPRFLVRNWPPDKFGQILAEWTGE